MVSLEDVSADLLAKEREIELQKEDLASKPEAIRRALTYHKPGEMCSYPLANRRARCCPLIPSRAEHVRGFHLLQSSCVIMITPAAQQAG